MNNYLIDTSFISSLYIDEDANNQTAVNALANLKAEDILSTSVLVLMELQVATITHSPKFQNIIDHFTDTICDTIYVVDSDIYMVYTQIVAELTGKLSIADITILATAKTNTCTIFSFDKKLNAAAAKFKIPAPLY